jgi:hypothetical protein
MENRFIEIFQGLKQDVGIAYLNKLEIDPNTGKKRPVYGWQHKPITDQDYLDHLSGNKSIGIQPCNEENMARFGVIDIDDKQHSYDNFPYKKYLDIIKELSLPLIPVKSKSGGLHLYLFLKTPARALFVKNFLETLLFSLGLPSQTEIYPKQTELVKQEDGKLSVGQFINLPYFKKQERLAINFDGKPFTFEQFIQVVELNLKTPDELEEFSIAHVKNVLQGGSSEFEDGPPCLQLLTKNKLTDGRDRFLYNYMVFAKKKYADNWDKKVVQAAQDYFEKNGDGINDWDEKKIRDKIRSWKKESTKGHSCTQEPIAAFCMKSECLKRKFGVASDRKNIFPSLSGLIKIEYPEPEYTFNVELPGGKGSTEVRAKDVKQIKDQEELRALIIKTANIYVPKVKGDEFETVLHTLFNNLKEIQQPPKGTTPNELLEEYLIEYINGPRAKSYASFKNGSILIDKDKDGNTYAYFKYSNFYKALKNKEWKENKSKTAEVLQGKQYKAEFGFKKRFPKSIDKNAPDEYIVVIKINVANYLKSIVKTEIIQIKGNKDVF